MEKGHSQKIKNFHLGPLEAAINFFFVQIFKDN